MSSSVAITDIAEITNSFVASVASMSLTYWLIFLNTHYQVGTMETHAAKPSPFALREGESIFSMISRLYAGFGMTAATSGMLTAFSYFMREKFKPLRTWLDARLTIDKALWPKLASCKTWIIRIIVDYLASALNAVAMNPLMILVTRESVGKVNTTLYYARTTSQQPVVRLLGSCLLSLINIPWRMGQILVDLLRQEGIAGIFRGLDASIVLAVNPVIALTTECAVRQWQYKREITQGVRIRQKSDDLDRPKLGTLKDNICVLIGKLTATFFTYPFLLIRSRLHVKDKAVLGGDGGDGGYLGILWAIYHDAMHLWSTQGITAFYTNFWLKAAQTIPGTVFMEQFRVSFHDPIFWLYGLANPKPQIASTKQQTISHMTLNAAKDQTLPQTQNIRK